MNGHAEFHRLAEAELNEAARYYESQESGLGVRFLTTVQRSVDSVVEHPDAGVVVLDDIHRRLVPGFPYGLLYARRQGGIRILAVMNLKRRPMYWVGRE